MANGNTGLGKSARSVLDRNTAGENTSTLFLGLVGQAGEGWKTKPPRADSRPRVIVLIPAHNEVRELPVTLTAVYSQTRPPDEVYVLTDNATPGLVEAAAAFPCSITSTVGNAHKKAGNLNAALKVLLPQLTSIDVIMGFDADGVPEKHFIENAMRWLDRGYGAVGATFHGRSGGGLLGAVQRSEFARFARHQARKLRCDVLSGTGYAIRVGVMSAIAASRSDGQVYDVEQITEDFEMTLALRHAGVPVVSPANCGVTTDVMTTTKDWASQRLRWQHGTLLTLLHYGWSSITREMIVRQILIYLMMLATPLTVIYLIWSFLLFGWAGIDPAHAPLYAIGLFIVLLEQAWQARKAGKTAVILTLLIVPDFLYSVARQFVYIRAAWRTAIRKQARWGAGNNF